MQLEVLERDVRIEPRILVVQPHDETDRQSRIGHGVHESAPELLLIERIAKRVHHRAGRQPPGGHVPELLDADGKQLRLTACADIRPPHELLRQIATDAVGQNRHLGAYVNTGLEIGARAAMTADAAVSGAHAGDARSLHEELGRGEAREHVDAFRLHQPRQPFAELLQRNDEVAVIAQGWRRERKRDPAGLREEVDAVFVHLRRQRRAFGLEVGDELAEGARIEHRARQQVRAGLARLSRAGPRQATSRRISEAGRA